MDFSSASNERAVGPNLPSRNLRIAPRVVSRLTSSVHSALSSSSNGDSIIALPPPIHKPADAFRFGGSFPLENKPDCGLETGKHQRVCVPESGTALDHHTANEPETGSQ